jgi:hypothetical protein
MTINMNNLFIVILFAWLSIYLFVEDFVAGVPAMQTRRQEATI